MVLVVLKGSVKLPRVKRGEAGLHIGKGKPLPEGYLSEAEEARLVKAGILGPDAPASVQGSPLPPTRGRWCRDPASLAGLSIGELLTAVTEIDPEFSGAEELGEAALVQLLTADFDPAFRLPSPAGSTDRNRTPEAALTRARARARAE